jgi:ArsR family transcriptional regulator
MRIPKRSENDSGNGLGTDVILEILSNQTRRKILSILAEEPMYFNQLANKVHVGQQAILRHMAILEKYGIVKSYGEKSTFGAPNRKYYKVCKSFNLNISLSNDSFSITNREEFDGIHKTTSISKLYKDVEALPVHANSLLDLRQALINVENQIQESEEKVNDLRALKQKILYNLHSIFPKDKFDPFERDIIYKIIKSSPDSLESLSELLATSTKETSVAVNHLYTKLSSNEAKRFLRKYRPLKPEV